LDADAQHDSHGQGYSVVFRAVSRHRGLPELTRTSIRSGLVVDDNTANIATLVTNVGAIKTKTDNLPADTATAIAAIPTTDLSTDVGAIKTKTDNLPADTAAEIAKKDAWVLQELLTQTKTPPTQNEWYTLLSTATGGIKLLSLNPYQENSETNSKSVEVEITIDGRVVSGSLGLINEENHSCIRTKATNNLSQVQKYGLGLDYNTFIASTESITDSLIGNSVQIRYRMTSAVGTNQVLSMTLEYAVLTKVT